MRARGRRRVTGALALLFLGCTDSFLFDQRRDAGFPVDRTVSLEGSFCTPGTNSVSRPIKIAFVMDGSGSMQTSDPLFTRVTAMANLLNQLVALNNPNIYVYAEIFSGLATACLSCPQGATGFTQLTGMGPTGVQALATRLQNYSFNAGVNQPARGSTTFVVPLDVVYGVILDDISAYQTQAQASGTAPVLADYSVIFLSDGAPDPFNEDGQLFPPGTAVSRLRALSALSDSVTLNTVHVMEAPAGPCQFDAGFAACSEYGINLDAQRLKHMAQVGGGQFRDFRNGEAIDFLSFNLGQFQRTWVVNAFGVSNFSALPDSPDTDADSDSDGLPDSLELQIGTDPLNADTDGDGFSDYVEYKYGVPTCPVPSGPNCWQVGGLNPLVPNTGCPNPGVDTDCDGLTDCDEQIVGTNQRGVDTDSDGAPDYVEWLIGTQPASPDMAADPDNDGLQNRNEIQYHTNPLVEDVNHLTENAYRTSFTPVGSPDGGSQCYQFRVENVLLANTLPDVWDGGAWPANWVQRVPTGRGRGYNDLYVYYSVVPADDPSAATQVYQQRIQQVARYPVGGIRSPVDGNIIVNPAKFAPGCP